MVETHLNLALKNTRYLSNKYRTVYVVAAVLGTQ